ncbi:MAG: sigma-70 family RNA polymerase sigma factor [Ktedonobacteraceae bacterium]
MIAYFLRMFKAIRKLLSKQEEHRSHSFVPPQQDVIPVETNPPEAFTIDFHLVELLRIGDETAFTQLFNRYSTSMLRLTHMYVSEYAKEIVQETWFMVLQQLDRFHGQIPLKVWIFRALRDSIEAHLHTEGRSIVDFSQQNIQEIAPHPTVAPWGFFSQGNPNTEGRWFSPPQQWQSLPENHLASSTIRVYLQQVIQGLALELQEIVTLRDIEGWTADEVCSLLEITDESQRVLLHHARTQIRHGLEQYFSKERI